MHEFFKALSSPQRLKLLRHLLDIDEPICYCELEGVIERDRSVIYRHLKKLESVGLLETRRAGKRVECEVREKDKVEKLLELANQLTNQEVNSNES
ncbi:winged helix-turn-helix transcriptional regulator [Candidatus Bipolaricaulota bacterium]|nr:winged helix-turn-helix transcriptional regulator [Candidatus Bipolaricaulota bacterium]MBS3825065.1 winged helix-turn-helix transcriptional regulator [Candidatus Bipolaricaulota bacterium]